MPRKVFAIRATILPPICTSFQLCSCTCVNFSNHHPLPLPCPASHTSDHLKRKSCTCDSNNSSFNFRRAQQGIRVRRATRRQASGWCSVRLTAKIVVNSGDISTSNQLGFRRKHSSTYPTLSLYRLAIGSVTFEKTLL